MKSFIYLLAIIACIQSVLGNPVRSSSDDEDWAAFKLKHNKMFHNSSIEAKRKNAFVGALRHIRAHNSNPANTFTLATNEYSDLEPAEFVSQMNGFKASSPVGLRNVGLSAVMATAPASIDWRTVGWVTPVKNQGQCGSCWSFSATGALEGMQKNRTGTLPNLSEQNLIDCSSSYGNQGCNGGLMTAAFNYVKANGGLDTEISYPYKGVQSTCKYSAANSALAGLTGYVNIATANEAALQQAVGLIGPVSVGIDASLASFQYYSSGIYNDTACSSTSLDHGVLVVGYGADTTGHAYWIVKNSWGTTWGQQGYFWLARNSGNKCGIATMASYPKFW